MSAEVPAVNQAFDRSPLSAASITHTWTPICAHATDQGGVRRRIEGSGIEKDEIGPPADPVFDRRFAGHDVHGGEPVRLQRAGQSIGQQVAAGDQDPGGNARRTDSILNDGGHGFRPLRALPRGLRGALERSAPPPLFVAELPPLLIVTCSAALSKRIGHPLLPRTTPIWSEIFTPTRAADDIGGP